MSGNRITIKAPKAFRRGLVGSGSLFGKPNNWFLELFSNGFVLRNRNGMYSAYLTNTKGMRFVAGIMTDKHEVFEFVKSLAERGDLSAQCILGYMYDHGEGVAKDKAQSARWFRRALTKANGDVKEALPQYGSNTEAERPNRLGGRK